MKKYTQKQLKQMVENGLAIDVTRATNRNEIPESYEKVGCSMGVNGLNGALLQGNETGKYYAITKRSTSLLMFY